MLLNVTSESNVLDSLIAVIIILGSLSVMTEKIVELIRKNKISPSKNNKLGFFTNINSDDPENFELKKNEIDKLAVIVGTIVALLANANLFELISANGNFEFLFWGNTSGCKINYQFVTGILFTGFIISFSSNFFHDLLETLYFIKQGKRHILNKPKDILKPDE